MIETRPRRRSTPSCEPSMTRFGTPPPAPGIERLAFLAVDAAYLSLRADWEAELQERREGTDGL